MFTELKPLLAKRSLTITVATLKEEQIRVNVVPHPVPEDTKANEQIKHQHKSEIAEIPEEAIKALTTPLSLTGTAEEIDTKIATILLEFTESHEQLQATFDRASQEISEAVKAIDERNKNKSKSKAPTNDKKETKEDKSKPEEKKSKADEPLPLWWTDSSAKPPGVEIAGQASAESSNTTASNPNPENKEVPTSCQ